MITKVGLPTFREQIPVAFLMWLYKAFQQLSLLVGSNLVTRLSFGWSIDVFPGMHGNQPNIMDGGAALYGKALGQLSARIQDESTRYDHENVSATLALHLYEVSRSRSKTSTSTEPSDNHLF